MTTASMSGSLMTCFMAFSKLVPPRLLNLTTHSLPSSTLKPNRMTSLTTIHRPDRKVVDFTRNNTLPTSPLPPSPPPYGPIIWNRIRPRVFVQDQQRKGVNQHSQHISQAQQRPESPSGTLTRHVSKYRVQTFHPSDILWGCTFSEIYVSLFTYLLTHQVEVTVGKDVQGSTES